MRNDSRLLNERDNFSIFIKCLISIYLHFVRFPFAEIKQRKYFFSF